MSGPNFYQKSPPLGLGDHENPETPRASKGVSTVMANARDARSLEPVKTAPVGTGADYIFGWLNAYYAARDEDDDPKASEYELPNYSQSVTSTILYGQESFQKHQPKVYKMVESILPPNCHVTRIQRMKGGGNHRVASVSFSWPANKEFKVNGVVVHEARPKSFEIHAVYRSTRQLEGMSGRFEHVIKSEYTFLTALNEQGIRVPRILAYDTTPENPLGNPYSLLLRVPGISLEDAFPNLRLIQKIRVARLIADELKQWELVGGDSIGFIGTDNDRVPNKLSFPVEYAEAVNDARVYPLLEEDIDGNKLDLSCNTYLWMKRLLTHLCQSCFDPNSKIHQTAELGLIPEDGEKYQTLLDILEDMNDYGWFGPEMEQEVAIHHPDFFARNVIVSSNALDPDSTHFIIEAVIDWDNVMSLPEPIRSTPPCWLWEGTRMEVTRNTERPAWYTWYGDPDELHASRYEFDLSPDDKKIKKVFDEEMGAKRCKYMYGEHYIWVRRLWKFAVSGLQIGEDRELERYQRFVRGWNQFTQLPANGRDFLERPRSHEVLEHALEKAKKRETEKSLREQQLKDDPGFVIFEDTSGSEDDDMQYTHASRPRSGNGELLEDYDMDLDVESITSDDTEVERENDKQDPRGSGRRQSL